MFDKLEPVTPYMVIDDIWLMVDYEKLVHTFQYSYSNIAIWVIQTILRMSCFISSNKLWQLCTYACEIVFTSVHILFIFHLRFRSQELWNSYIAFYVIFYYIQIFQYFLFHIMKTYLNSLCVRPILFSHFNFLFWFVCMLSLNDNNINLYKEC